MKKDTKFTKEQIDTVVDEFFLQLNQQLIDLIYEPANNDEHHHLDDMTAFVFDTIIHDMRKPITLPKLKAMTAKIMGGEKREMAKDLIFAYVQSVIAKEKVQVPAPKQDNLFNKTRGLN